MSVQKEFEGQMMVATFLHGQEKIWTSSGKKSSSFVLRSEIEKKEIQNVLKKFITGF
jgi:translation initiation factor 2 beta subunit (eIF-2beta)/eIF-5